MGEKMGSLDFFFIEHGGLERSFGAGVYSSLIKVRTFHLPYFGIMFERGPEFL